MISSLNPRDQIFLNNLNQISDRLDRAQREVSSGVRLAQVSDDPDQVSALLATRASLSSAQQTQTNLGRTKAEVDVSEQSVSSAVDLLERAQTLAAEGASSIQTADGRAALGQEVGSILQQLGGLAATQVEGRYVFSGDSDQAPPYTVDLSLATPVSSYLGSAATRTAQHPNGTTFTVSHTAQEIFDSTDPTTNVFASLTTLRQALLNNDSAGISASVDGLTKVDSYLNSQLSFYGATQDKVAEATDFGDTLQLQLKTQISTLEDADPTEAILEMNQALTQQQAALGARARLPRTSLFDFLA